MPRSCHSLLAHTRWLNEPPTQIRTDLPQAAVRDEIGDSFEVLVVSMRTELGHPYLGGLFVAGDPVVPRRVYAERGGGEVHDGRSRACLARFRPSPPGATAS